MCLGKGIILKFHDFLKVNLSLDIKNMQISLSLTQGVFPWIAQGTMPSPHTF